MGEPIKASDEEILADWKKTPSVTFLAGRYGMSARRLGIRIAALRARGHDLPSPDLRSPHFSNVEREKRVGVIRGNAKILLLDIESAPIIAGIWQLRTDYVPPDHIMRPGYTLCVSTKWLGDREIRFYASWDGKERMRRQVHRELNQADAVVHFNGSRYDIPILQREFVEAGEKPPSPYKQVDLLKTVKTQFRFESSKLDYVCQRLGLGVKVKNKGMDLWWECMQGVKAAHQQMRRYNERDVVLLEKLYHRLLPWIRNHPNLAAFVEALVCPSCESTNFKRDKNHLAQMLKYPRYQCSDCGTWFKSSRTVSHRAGLRHAAAR